MNLACLVRVEPALPRRAHLIGYGSDRVRTDAATFQLLARRVGERVSVSAAAGQFVVDVSLAGGAQHGQVRSEA